MGFISNYKRIFEDILSLVLQNRFTDIEQLSDEALFGISESRGRLRHLTDWPWKIDHVPVPSKSLPRIIVKVSLSKECHFGGRLNQWSVPAIILFAKNADYENEKCLKIKVFICILPSKEKKRTPFFNFDQPL